MYLISLAKLIGINASVLLLIDETLNCLHQQLTDSGPSKNEEETNGMLDMQNIFWCSI